VELVVPDKADLLARLRRLEAALARALARRRDGARQHLELVSRRLPDLRRTLVDLRFRVDEQAEVLRRRCRRAVLQQEQRLRLASSRLVLLSPRRASGSARQRLAQMAQMLGQGFLRGQADRRRHLEYGQGHLDKLNPLAILQRGYAVALQLPEATVIRDATLVPPGAAVRVRVARGRLDCEVLEVSGEPL
jgi:exodeoxyribonuclease VII large subunit